ncbi:hypothetical protein HAX54_035050, partial [Datura stramonium]|nr:hypothetical protein [Datura stramonium]
KINDDELGEVWKIQRDALDKETPENAIKVDDDKEPTSEIARPGGEQGPTSNEGQGFIPEDL